MIGESRRRSRHHEALLGVFQDAPSMLGGMDVRCPVCGQHSAKAWASAVFIRGDGLLSSMTASKSQAHSEVSVDWMHCANEACGELVIRIHEHGVAGAAGLPIVESKSWLGRPQWAATTRHVDPLVPEPFRSDYQEAAAILDLSPRMSAVMSRRIVADLLAEYAKQPQFSLEAKIDGFAKDSAHPAQLRTNLHHFREIANFGAHTQKDDQAQVIDVGTEEAEWTLDLLDRLFDYFIVGPERDRRMREAMDERIKQAGRKAIKPPSEGEA